MVNVADLFKSPHEDRPKAKYDYSQGLTGYGNHIYAKNYTPSSYRNDTNTFSMILRDEDLQEVKLIGKDGTVTNLPIEACNRVEFFYAPGGKKVDYSEVTKVEEIQASEYDTCPTCQLKKIGFTKFYQLYIKHELNKNLEVELCKMATR